MTERYRVLGPTISHELVGDEVVIVSYESGAYYGLRGVGADIWVLTCARASVAEMAAALASRYQVTSDETLPQVVALIARLREEGLIGLCDDGVAGGETPALVGAPPFAPPELEKYSDLKDLLLLDPIHEVVDGHWKPSTGPASPGSSVD